VDHLIAGPAHAGAVIVEVDGGDRESRLAGGGHLWHE
jgi:hypothetical protein